MYTIANIIHACALPRRTKTSTITTHIPENTQAPPPKKENPVKAIKINSKRK